MRPPTSPSVYPYVAHTPCRLCLLLYQSFGVFAYVFRLDAVSLADIFLFLVYQPIPRFLEALVPVHHIVVCFPVITSDAEYTFKQRLRQAKNTANRRSNWSANQQTNKHICRKTFRLFFNSRNTTTDFFHRFRPSRLAYLLEIFAELT